MLLAHTFRLFVSSTFSDLVAEREALQKVVFPELEKYCAERGAHFQAVDLRWGITEEAQREHDTMRICLEEVRRCQQLSPRPNFAVLMGDRYGWEPVPARIPQDHWLRLMNAASQVDRELIKSSYRLDENAVPPVYCLRERTPDHEEVHRQESKLLQTLRRAAKGFRGGARLPYFASATHQEIALGALSLSDERRKALNPEQHVQVYVRHIEGMPHDESAMDFIDWDVRNRELVPGARERLCGLERQLRRKLGDHVHDLHTNWSRHGRNGRVDKAYLKRFCDAFLDHQKVLIDAELALLERIDEHQQREQAHQDFGSERARVFVGRKAMLARMARYTSAMPKGKGPQSAKNRLFNVPIFLLGGGGSGKSALLARSALDAIWEAKRSGGIVLQRYVGGVPGTDSLMGTLTELTFDINIHYDQPQPSTPENSKALVENFRSALGHASVKRPLILYLDALDQLDKADGAWILEWLPEKLPEHVRVIASARTGTNVEQSARRRYPRSLSYVPSLNAAEGRAMLNAWLADKRGAWFNSGIAPSTGRRLKPQQEKAVLAASDGSALWLKLAYEEAATWASWNPPRQLPTTVEGLIEDLIDRRLIKQENHPKVFTERALAFLTAGRFGLSETELGRALGTDPAVRTEFEVNEKTHIKWKYDKHLPPILWSRLYFHLQNYLGQAHVDGAFLMRWFHREFGEVLKARYLDTLEQQRVVHGALADTFLHLERELRHSQANDGMLFLATDASGNQVSTAVRRVMEQPWQLARADRVKELEDLLSDFGFCLGKCAANRAKDLAADVRFLRRSGGPHSSWFRHLIAWNNRLCAGASSWPSHRILAQLTAESVEFKNFVRSPNYSKLMSSIPVAIQITGVEELQLRRITQLQGLALTAATKFLLFNERWLLGIDVTGVGVMIDAETDSAVGVPTVIGNTSPSLDVARVFGVQAYAVKHFNNSPVKDDGSGFNLETRYSGVLRVHGSELVLGNGDVEYLGSTDAEWMFSCDGQIILVSSERLLDPGVESGCFSVEGARIDLYEDMNWDYSRFGISVFLDNFTLLSLGWQQSHIRDEIKAEVWHIGKAGTSRQAEISFNDSLDLPLALLGVLEDGRIVFTGENYRRSYLINPNSSMEGAHLWPIHWSWIDPKQPDIWGSSNTCDASDWQWPRNIGRALKRPSQNRLQGMYASSFLHWVRIGASNPFNNRERLQYEELPLVHCAEFLDEGALVLWGDMQEIDAFNDPSTLVVQDRKGREIRWYSDVPIRSAVRISATEIVVIKKTGPVRISFP